MWYHAAGCRRYFNATRDTNSYQIHETYKMGELPTVTAKTIAAGALTALQGEVS
jgi:sarcosine oxidase subunit delta